MLRLGVPGRQVALLNYPIDPKPRPTIPVLFDLFATGTAAYRRTLVKIAAATESLGSDGLPWLNAFLPPLDAASLYGLIRVHRPRMYVEIGSGYSTVFARRAIDHSSLATRLISIDPSPREDIDSLCDEAIRVRLQDIDPVSRLELCPGDILFFDGSHQSFPNSDVTVFFTEILPSLQAGVIVGIHDIYLPDDYPDWFAATLPNEQYLLASWLLGRQTMDGVLLPCSFVRRHTSLWRLLGPLWKRIGEPDPRGGAFWFETSPMRWSGRVGAGDMHAGYRARRGGGQLDTSGPRMAR
jgi:hypothetical protein